MSHLELFIFAVQQIVLVIIICVNVLIQAPLYAAWDSESQFYHYGLHLPSDMSVQRMTQLLKKMTTQIHGKGFRYLGINEDFFHGHLLFIQREIEASKKLKAVAILYHTQEEAYAAHWSKTLDPKYDYLNVTTRNWIQWLDDNDSNLDGSKIENARRYLNTESRDPKQFEDGQVTPNKDWHYTIHSKNLDTQKLGFKIYAELQFEFYGIDCEQPEAQVSIVLGLEKTCLKLSTSNPLMPLIHR